MVSLMRQTIQCETRDYNCHQIQQTVDKYSELKDQYYMTQAILEIKQGGASRL